MKHGRQMWRKFMNKPPRRFRRKKGKGKGKNNNKGKSGRHYYEEEVEYDFFGGRKRGGKGKNRRNPKGPDGTTMTCHGCGSEDHLIKDSK
eukprot:10091223-Karenia_brevis.AAC.1